MNYQQTIDYLYHTLPMFSRMGSAAFKKDLDNIIILCEALGNPQDKFKSIHIGGTNGKGSVSHMMAAILQCQDLKVGLYTSPHLYDFRERIRLNGKKIDETFVIEFVERINPIIEKLSPSFFEITVAMAFDYFARQNVQVAVIEVGLGGRLDSTNIIKPELSIITNIGWDHMNILGNSLEEIAMEKAGIIKEHTPVVVGERQEHIDQVFIDKAKEKKAALYFASDEYEAIDYVWKDHLLEIQIMQKEEGNTFRLKSDLTGIYQGKNICTVLKAWDALKEHSFTFTESHEEEALKKVKELTGLQGRWELIRHQPRVVLDVAHNREGIKQMLLHLEYMKFEKLHIVIGMVKDKDVNQVLELLPTDANYYFSEAQIPRAMKADELRVRAEQFSLKGKAHNHVNDALEQAITKAGNNDLIIVCGSIFLVAEVDVKSISQLS